MAFPKGLQEEGLKIVSPPTLKLSSRPTPNPPSQSEFLAKYKQLPSSKSTSSENDYKSPITSGISYTYGEKFSSPFVKPSRVSSTIVSQKELPNLQLGLSSNPRETISNSTQTRISRQPSFKNFANPSKILNTFKEFSKNFGPRHWPKTFSNLHPNKQKTLPNKTKPKSKPILWLWSKPNNESEAKLRQSLKYVVRPQPFTLSKTVVSKPISSTSRPSSKAAMGFASTSSPLQMGSASSSFAKVFSGPNFPSFGKFWNS